MKESFFRTMTWLHSWTGLLVCWLLLLIFFAGTLSYYRYEINLWMKPELHSQVITDYDKVDLAATLVKGQAYLSDIAPHAASWQIRLPSHRIPYVSFAWQEPSSPGERGKFYEHVVTTEGRTITDVRATKGGHFFYRLHFDLHYLPLPLARYLVGFATMFMLLAIISGIVIHKRIFKDFFTLRLKKGPRSWLDGHTLTSVLALPYHLMITYTGLLALMFLYMPSALHTAFDGDRKALQQAVLPLAKVTASGHPAPQIALGSLLPSILEHAQGHAIKDIKVMHPGDRNSQIQVWLRNDQWISEAEPRLLFSGTDGRFLGREGESLSPMKQSYDTLIGLHAARFAEPTLRFAFFISGILGCVMIASGALLWTTKMRQKYRSSKTSHTRGSQLGLAICDGLNLGFITGLPIATAVFLWANRLLPWDLPSRYHFEINLFFIALGSTILLALCQKLRWHQALLAGSLLWLGVPLINAASSSEHLLSNIAKGQWFIAWVDIMALCFAALLMLGAHHSRQRNSPRTILQAKEAAL